MVAGEVFVNILMYVCSLECLLSEVHFILATGRAFGVFINVEVSFKNYFTHVCFLFFIFLLSQTLHIQIKFSVICVSKHVFG